MWKYLLLSGMLSAFGCSSGSNDDTQAPDSESDADSDSDTDADTDADNDTDSDVSYRSDVYPLLTRDCQSCHQSGHEDGMAVTGSAKADFHGIARQCNADNPQGSFLVTMPTGHNGHTLIWEIDSVEVLTCMQWAGDGCLDN